MKHAIVDIGSNTIRLIIFEVLNNDFKKILNKKYTAGLINYVEFKKLSDKGIKKLIETLQSIKLICDEVHVESLNAFATASLRNINNSKEIIRKVKSECKIVIDLLSQEDEAKIGNLGILHNTKVNEGISMDIGGASTEIVSFKKNGPLEIINLEIGSLQLFSKYVSVIIPKKKEFIPITNHIIKEISNKKFKDSYDTLIGIGGTIRATGTIISELWDKDKNEFDTYDLKVLLNNFKHKDLETIRTVIKVNPNRTHTIVPGILILKTVCQHLNIKKIIVSEEGLREGYLIFKVLRGG